MKPLNLPIPDGDACPDCGTAWGNDTCRCPSCGLTIEKIADRIAKAKPLHDTLVICAEHERQQSSLPGRGYEYAGPHDFVLREGTWFTAPEKPHSYLQGRPKACYGNAINMAAVYGLDYVEGYAASAIAPDMAIHHAWNLRDGVVVDTTWGGYDGDGHCAATIGSAYCGIVFSVERADDATWNKDATVIDDWKHDWPILRDKWHGEHDDAEWPASVRLEALYAHRDGDLQRSMALFRQMHAEVQRG